MRLIKKIVLIVATTFSVLAVSNWVITSLNQGLGGCLDTTKGYGWPYSFYTSSGQEILCGDILIPAKFSAGSLLVDTVVIACLCFWAYFLTKMLVSKIRTKK